MDDDEMFIACGGTLYGGRTARYAWEDDPEQEGDLVEREASQEQEQEAIAT